MAPVPLDGQGFRRMPFEGVGTLSADEADAGVVRFAYEKADGTLRKAAGTLHEVDATIKGTGRPNDALTIRYYDVEAGGWRSFKVENLIAIY